MAASTRLVLVLQVQGHKALGYLRERIMVGRGAQANFQVLDQHVANEHLEIYRSYRTIWIKDLGSVYGSQLNGIMMVPGKPLSYKEGDKLVLGQNVVLSLSISEVPTESREPKPVDEDTKSGTDPSLRIRRESGVRPRPEPEAEAQQQARNEADTRSRKDPHAKSRAEQKLQMERAPSPKPEREKTGERPVPASVKLAHSQPGPVSVVLEDKNEEEEVSSVTGIESLPEMEENADDKRPSPKPRRLNSPWGDRSNSSASIPSRSVSSANLPSPWSGPESRRSSYGSAPATRSPPDNSLELDTPVNAGDQIAGLHETFKQIHKDLDSERRELKEQLVSLRDQISIAKSELASIDNTKAQARKENEILSARVSEMSAQVRADEQGHAQVTRLVEQENETLADLRQQVKELNEQISRQRAALDAERAEAKQENLEHFSRAEGRIAGIAQALAELQKNAGQDKRNLAIELSQLRVQITSGMGELATLEERKNNLFEECESARGKLTDLNTQVHVAEAQYGDLQMKLNESNSAVDKSQAKLQQLEEETEEQQKIFEMERHRTLKESTAFRASVEAHTIEIQEILKGIESSVGEEKHQFHRELEMLQSEVQSARFEVGSLEELKGKLTAELDKYQASLGECAEQLRIKQTELTDTAKKFTDQRRENESLARETEKLRTLFQRAQQDADQVNREHELQKEKLRLDLQQVRTEVAEHRQALEAKGSKLHAAVEQLEIKKKSLDEAVAMLNDSRKGLEAQIESLRARELMVLEGNQKAQTTHEQLSHEMQTMRTEHEEATLRKASLNQELEALAKSREDMAEREDEARTTLAKLNDELLSLESYYQEQKRQRLETAVAEAEKQGQAVLQSARDEALAFREKHKLELERDVASNREKMRRELGEERAKEDADFRKLKEQHQSELQAGGKAIQKELTDKRALVEREIGERLAVERRNRELREEQEARAETESRQARILEISRALEHALGTRFQSEIKHGGEIGEKVQGVLNQMKALVARAFDPNAAALEVLGTELKVDVASKKRAGRFWFKLAGGLGGAVVVIGMLIATRGAISSYFSSIGAEPDAKKIAESMPRFQPTTDGKFKSTYTDNVLYTRGYKAMKLTPATQKRWILELNHFFLSELRLDDRAIVKFAGAESALIQELAKRESDINPDPDFQKNGIQRLRDAETSAMADLTTAVGGEENFRKVHQFEARFYSAMVLGSTEQASTPPSGERSPAESPR